VEYWRRGAPECPSNEALEQQGVGVVEYQGSKALEQHGDGTLEGWDNDASWCWSQIVYSR
jgi:hypothetical protein